MKRLILVACAAASLSACTDLDKQKAGGLIVGAGAVALCVHSGVCVF